MVELSDAAAKDIEQILSQSIVDFGAHQTEQYYRSLKNCLELLGANPRMGSSADDILPGYRRFVHDSHVVFYRDTGRGVFIVRVLPKRMDIRKQFTND